MGTSPFLNPAKSPRRRRRPSRSRWRAGAIAALALVIVVAAAVMALAHSHDAHGSTTARGRHRRAHPAAVAVRARSAIGLPLGTPAFALPGIGALADDVVHTSFAEPPRAGLLFNLDTGEVLWQLRSLRCACRVASLTKMMTALIAVESAPPGRQGLRGLARRSTRAAGSKVGVFPLVGHGSRPGRARSTA